MPLNPPPFSIFVYFFPSFCVHFCLGFSLLSVALPMQVYSLGLCNPFLFLRAPASVYGELWSGLKHQTLPIWSAGNHQIRCLTTKNNDLRRFWHWHAIRTLSDQPGLSLRKNNDPPILCKRGPETSARVQPSMGETSVHHRRKQRLRLGAG